MFTGFFLSLREGLEAALIIGIVLSLLERLNQKSYWRYVWWGVIAASSLSALLGFSLSRLGLALEGKAEEVFEGITMLLAAGLLTGMILWLQNQGGWLRQKLEMQTERAVAGGSVALFSLAFLSILREGVELSLFLVAASLTAGSQPILIGALVGLLTAMGMGWSLFGLTRRLNLKSFFQVTNILLIFFAAGLVGLGVHELNEAGWIPALIDPLWDINPYLSDQRGLGLTLKSLLGYNGNPSLTEAAAYLLYLTILAVRFWRSQRTLIIQPLLSTR